MNKKRILLGCLLGGTAVTAYLGINQLNSRAQFTPPVQYNPPAVTSNQQLEYTKKSLENIKFQSLTSYKGSYLLTNRYMDPSSKKRFFFVSGIDKYGYINEDTGVFIEPMYDSVKLAYFDIFEDGIEPVQLNGKWGYINEENQVKIDFKYQEAARFSEGLATVKLNGKYGYVNKEGKLVIPAKYKEAYYFQQGYAIVLNSKDKDVLIDSKGNELYTADGIEIMENGYIKILDNQKEGIGKLGQDIKIIVSPKYDLVDIYEEDDDIKFYCNNYDNDVFKVFDDTGKDITKSVDIEPNYNEDPIDYIHTDKKTGISLIHKDGRYGYAKGKTIIIKPQYEFAESFDSNSLALVAIDTDTSQGVKAEMGLIDITGKTIVEPKYMHIIQDDQQKGIYFLRSEDNKVSVYNHDTKTLLKGVYDEVYLYKNNLVYFLGEKSGLMSFTGEEIVKAYKDFNPEEHNKGYIVGRNDGVYYITNMKTKQTINLDKNIINVRTINKYGYRLSSNFYKKGLLNADGQEILPCIFESISFLDENTVRVIYSDSKEMKMGIINLKEQV